MLKKLFAVLALVSFVTLASPAGAWTLFGWRSWGDHHYSWNNHDRDWGNGSCNPIPEPGAALLFGVGALWVSRRLQRR